MAIQRRANLLCLLDPPEHDEHRFLPYMILAWQLSDADASL